MSGSDVRGRGFLLAASALVLVLNACGTTVDTLGDSHPELRPLTRPAQYPNAFRDLLGKSDAEIAAKIAAAFAALYHGDPSTQAVYFPVGSDSAYIRDILHDDVRTEGIGWGMLIAVELDKQDEFDRLWTYATTTLERKAGPERGYFQSFCDAAGGTAPCLDPFGLEQFVMALIFAHDRWAAAPGGIDYGAAALGLLDLMLHKEEANGGIVGGVTNTFDAVSKLPFDLPTVSAANYSRPAVAMPGYYGLWAQATGDSFWQEAALAARGYWQLAANPSTGLLPVRATFAGVPVPGSDTFSPEAYRAQLNMTLDQIWSAGDPWNVEESNRLLGFFSSQGIDQYGGSYSLDGQNIDPARESALVLVNGISALIATNGDRAAYVNAVWNLDIPSGTPRYYAGMLDLLALLVLSGQFRVY